jgi:hypothetical protein
VTDPETGDKVFRAVYTDEIWDGAAKADAPDIQLGYAEGYQTGKGVRRRRRAEGPVPAQRRQVER